MLLFWIHLFVRFLFGFTSLDDFLIHGLLSVTCFFVLAIRHCDISAVYLLS